MDRLKIVFMGTPDFAVPCLHRVFNEHEVALVVTQPDRPSGRGQKLKAPPVKEYALQHGIECEQPLKVKDNAALIDKLVNLSPDVIVVVAFGQILPPSILAIPRYGCINVHASLLPAYRGAAPIHWAIINGENESGVTTMFMDEGLDTGDMILMDKIAIGGNMTTGQLHDALMERGASLLSDTLARLAAGRQLPRTVQSNGAASYAPLLTKELERIDWRLTADAIHNLIRGLNPWPGAVSSYNGKPVKFWRSALYEPDGAPIAESGVVTAFTEHGFLIATGNGMLEILEVQPASKKKMTARDFISGYKVKLNDKFM